MLPGGSSRIPPFELTSPEPEIVPPVIVVRPLTVITPEPVRVPPLISSVVAFRALVPKFAVPPSIITVGIVPAYPGKEVVKLSVPEVDVKARRLS